MTFTATVTATTTGPITPNGTVTFTQGTTTLCSAVALSGGTAQCAAAFPTDVGSPFTVIATYTSSDANFIGSSGTVSQIVTATSTTTAVVSSLPSGSTVNQTVTFTATVTPAFTGTTSPMGNVRSPRAPRPCAQRWP